MTEQIFTRFLDTVGDKSGVTENNIDYSGAATKIKMTVPSEGNALWITRLSAQISDTSIDPDGYGGLSALTNGIEIFTEDSVGILADLTDSVPIQTHNDWLRFATDLEEHAGSVFVRWDLAQRIRLTPGESLVVQLHDDFSGLTRHLFSAIGYVEGISSSGRVLK